MHNMILIFILFQILHFNETTSTMLSVSWENSRVLWKNFCVEKHNNFNITILQEKKERKCSIDEMCIIDFAESTIRGRTGGVWRVEEFQTHFNPFPASAQLVGFFVQR